MYCDNKVSPTPDAAMGADVIVMAEHGLTKEAMEHALEWVGEMTGMTGAGAAVIPIMAGGAAAGVAVMWDPARMRRCGAVKEEINGRALRVPLMVEGGTT